MLIAIKCTLPNEATLLLTFVEVLSNIISFTYILRIFHIWVGLGNMGSTEFGTGIEKCSDWAEIFTID